MNHGDFEVSAQWPLLLNVSFLHSENLHSSSFDVFVRCPFGNGSDCYILFME